MAEATGTNLTVPDQNQAVDNEPENKSGFMDTLGSADDAPNGPCGCSGNLRSHRNLYSYLVART